MAKYDHIMLCPSCGARDLNLLDYTSLMVLKPHLGLFTMVCPSCQAKITSIQAIPSELEASITLAADTLGAGMGRDLLK